VAPAEVYAKLLDRGTYLCSPRTMYRVLGDAGEVRERRDQLVHPEYKKPDLPATGPNQVWSWDITKLLSPAKWTYFYLYVVNLLDAARVDEAKVLAQADKLMGYEREVKRAHLTMLVRIRNLLTDAERAKLAAKRK